MSNLKLNLTQAKKIRDNNYLLTDRSKKSIDYYDGVGFSRHELNQLIWKLENKKQERENEKLLREIENIGDD